MGIICYAAINNKYKLIRMNVYIRENWGLALGSPLFRSQEGARGWRTLREAEGE